MALRDSCAKFIRQLDIMGSSLYVIVGLIFMSANQDHVAGYWFIVGACFLLAGLIGGFITEASKRYGKN